jgi:hypothetical protein
VEGGQAFACRDIRPGRNDRGAISMVSAERASPRQSPNSGCNARCSDQQRCGETAGAWFPCGSRR